ncbi:MAG: hypothetical protein H7039_15775 [Bryobacteraceae bacterium]|nr:hypothetical protein [Bryobacteraceae bacterium]
MLKIGSVRWKGRCSRHSGYYPELDGRAGIKGGCRRCEMLFEIWDHHQNMVRLMREFGLPKETGGDLAPVEERQLSLLD